MIEVRSPTFRFGSDIPKVWFDGNTFSTFLFNGLNLVFPLGERLFVRAVHDHREQISDPELLAKIRGFAGQEGRHAQAHEQFFDRLRTQGFDFERFLRAYGVFMRLVNKRPASVRLAVSAALEHYTATIAMFVFKNDKLLRDTHPEMRKLVLWHAAEELEHREVVFDVWRSMHSNYLLRLYAFWAGSLSILFWTFLGMRLFVKQSGTPWRVVLRDLRIARKMTGGRFGWSLICELLAFLKPSFHPNQAGSLEEPLAWLREGLG